MSDHSENESANPARRVQQALRQIRREAWKAALIHAIVEAVAVFLVVNLLLSVIEPTRLPIDFGIFTSLVPPAVDALGGTRLVTQSWSALVATGLGLVALSVGIWRRVRRPLVEQFEAVNPSVAESLQTARDAVEDDADSLMATRLFEDVLDRLEETSSRRLVNVRRTGVILLVAMVASVATVQVSVHDIKLGSTQSTGETESLETQSTNFTGLKAADEVLGEPEDVSVGDENLTASVESTGGDREIETQREFPTRNGARVSSGIDSTASQQAGFDSPEQIENAQLIREYNVRIRTETTEN